MFAILLQFENKDQRIKHLIYKENKTFVVKNLNNERFEELFDAWTDYKNVYIQKFDTAICAYTKERDNGKYQVIESVDSRIGFDDFMKYVDEKILVL